MSDAPDPILSENALRTLQARYLWKDATGAATETPRQLYERVANFVASAQKQYGATDEQVRATGVEFYEAMALGKFLPNSPTLMNAGRTLGVLSACFVLPIGDSVDEIFDSVKHTAQVQRAGGGTGFSFDRLRPTGDYIAGSGGRTSGPISFWRVFSEATRAIQQGAFRRGANMGMMSLEHPDILKFITSKNDLAAFDNFNISIKVTNEFMRLLRAEPQGLHVVTNPRTGRRYLLPRGLDIAAYSVADLVPVDSPRADGTSTPRFYTRRALWGMIVQGAWSTGEPGLCFIDRVNQDNPTPHLGPIEATNPCGEQPLLPYEACNLGSIDLSKFVRRQAGGAAELDERGLRAMIRLGVRFLDNVIDVNNYIIPKIERICEGNRKIGLGLMGLADAMYDLDIKYDSTQGIAFAKKVASILREEAFAASEALAMERGAFPNWPQSIWSQRGGPMRNAAVTTAAPTGTLSILAGCSGGIEPVFALAFYRHVLEGQELFDVCRPFERYAREHGFWSRQLAMELAQGKPLSELAQVDAHARELFVTAHDIAPADHVRMQAAFQEFIDGAISKTINLPTSALPKDVNEVYQLAFDLGCKGVTVYRDGCRASQPMALDRLSRTICPQCRGLLPEEPGCSRCPGCGATLCSP